MSAMKLSGIAWIGHIPADWEMKKVKYISILKGRIGWQGLTSDEYTDEGSYLITGTDFDNGGINWETCVHVPMKRWEEAKDIQIENGDLLITKDGTVGKVAIVNGLYSPCSLNSGVLRISTINGYDRRFLFWVLQSEVFWTWFAHKNAGNSTILHLYQGDFAEFNFATPPLAEQRAIAAFLDDHCGHVDGIIADLERQVEILRQYKKALITETVTKGLDKTVPMKDSGIDWIGEIPSHWEINKLRYLASMCSGATPSKDNLAYWEGDIPWISSMEVKTDIIEDTSLHISAEAVRSCSTRLLPVGTPVMVVRSGILQHTLPIALTGVPATINQDVKAFFFKPSMKPAFFKYYIQGLNDYLLTALCKEKSTVDNIDGYLLLNCPLPVPPIKEQESLIVFLDDKCGEVNDLIAEKLRSAEIMRQYKRSLIYEYVTGKKRVAS